MKDFSSIIKTKFNAIFGAGFTEDTTESEMLDFLEKNEASLAEKLTEKISTVEAVADEVKLAQEALKADTDEGINALTSAISLLADAQKASNEKVQSIEAAVKQIAVGMNNVPRQKTGDPTPELGTSNEDENEFNSKPAAKAVLEAVKSIIPMS